MFSGKKMEGKSSTCTYDELENIILNGSSGPCSLPLEYLRRITNNFADERLLGEGGFGKVYKGVLQNGKMVAVKKLNPQLKPGVQEKQFENEVYNLMRLKHPNIVRFLGYCYETQNECVEHGGKFIFAEMQRNKLICLEYLPKGSLESHLSDESSGHEWRTRYKIIKEICCGLLYLHEECQCQFGASIIHLDLKPGNILLDEYMGPKIADFGLSRLFEDNKTQTCASIVSGTLGYMAPEYLLGRIVTAKADTYSLGVIITEVITGRKVNIFDVSTPTFYQKFVDGVINNWRNRLGGALSETDCEQIKCCLEIGLGCIKFNREERPTSREIIERLDRLETLNCNVNNEKRPPADQILTHMEEKLSASTTSYESTFSALQSNITDRALSVMRFDKGHCRQQQPNITGVRSYTGAGPRLYGFFHRQLSRVMKFLSGVMTYLSSLLPRRRKHGKRHVPLPLSRSARRKGRLCSSDMEYTSVSYDSDNECTLAQMGPATMGYLGHLAGSRLQESEFLSEVAFLSLLRHKHLVGYCAENDEHLLVSEYMRNGSLYDHLHPKATPSETSPSLVMSSWKLRIRILLDASRGIEYLHTYTYAVQPIIHGDVKSSNILLDARWRARVSGFGLSSSAQVHHRNTIKVAGTVGYMDPEYYSLQHLTVKSDVYGFGVVMLEVLTGKRAILDEEADEGGASALSVVDYAVPSIVGGELGKVLDPRVPEPDADEAEALGLVAYTALHCVQLKGKDRPGMEGIVASLQTAFDLCDEGSFDGDLVKSPSSNNSLPEITSIDQD